MSDSEESVDGPALASLEASESSSNEESGRSYKIIHPGKLRKRLFRRDYPSCFFPLSLLAGLLGFISLGMPWIYNTEHRGYDGIHIFYYLLAGEYSSIYAVIAWLILAGSILCFVVRFGGVLLLAAVILYATDIPQGEIIIGPGPFAALAAAVLGMISLAFPSGLRIPARLATMRLDPEDGLSINLLAMVAFGLGMASPFLFWITYEQGFIGALPLRETNYTMVSFLFGTNFDTLSLMLAGAALVATGSVVCILTPLGSGLQIAGVVLFFADYRSALGDWSSYGYVSSVNLGIGLYVCVIAAILGICSMMFVRRVNVPKRFVSSLLMVRVEPSAEEGPSPVTAGESRKQSRPMRAFAAMPRSARVAAVISIGLAALLILLAVPYGFAMSSLRLQVYNNYIENVQIDVYLDGVKVDSGYASPFEVYICEPRLKAGVHSIALDYAFSGDESPLPDGVMEWHSSFAVKPYLRFWLSKEIRGDFDPMLPQVQLSCERSTDAFTLTFEEIVAYSWYGEYLAEIHWYDLSVIMTDDVSSGISWSPSSADLDGGPFSTHDYGTQVLGTLGVNCTVVDIAGDGQASVGDYFELTIVSGELSEEADYVVYLMDDSDDAVIGQISLLV